MTDNLRKSFYPQDLPRKERIEPLSTDPKAQMLDYEIRYAIGTEHVREAGTGIRANQAGADALTARLEQLARDGHRVTGLYLKEAGNRDVMPSGGQYYKQ